MSSFIRTKGQAGRRLPTRASHRLSLPVGVKIAPIQVPSPEKAAASPEKSGQASGSILDIAIRAQQRHQVQEKAERDRIMKRLAETRSDRENNSASESPTHSPVGSPLLNGMAALALEAAAKKKAISS